MPLNLVTHLRRIARRMAKSGLPNDQAVCQDAAAILEQYLREPGDLTEPEEPTAAALRADLQALDRTVLSFAQELGIEPSTVFRWFRGESAVPRYAMVVTALHKVLRKRGVTVWTPPTKTLGRPPRKAKADGEAATAE